MAVVAGVLAATGAGEAMAEDMMEVVGIED